MKTKFTLYLDDQLLTKLKLKAVINKKSISETISDFILKGIELENQNNTNEIK